MEKILALEYKQTFTNFFAFRDILRFFVKVLSKTC